MSNIPEYQRRQLASSVVGTPGEDRSGQIIANSVAQTSSQLAATSLSLQQERQKALDKASAFEASLTYEGEIAKLSAQHAKDNAYFEGEPTKRAEALRLKMMEARTNMLASMQSDGQKQLFLEESGRTIQKAYSSELKNASENQVSIAATKLVSASNQLSNTVYPIFKDTNLTYDEKISALKEKEQLRVTNVKNSAIILGVEKADKFNQDSSRSLVKAATLGLLETSPLDAVKFLKDETVKEILGPEEHANWVEKAKKRAVDFKDIMEERKFQAVADSNSQEIEKFYSGQHDLASISAIKDPKTREYLTDAYLSTKQLSAEEIVDREADLVTQWQNFFEKDKAGNLTTKLKKDKKPQDVVELQQAYMDSFKITRTSEGLVKAAKQYPDMLSQAIKNQQPNPILKAVVDFFNQSVPFARAFANKSTKKNSSIDKAVAGEQSQMANIFFEKIANIDVNNPEQLQNAVRSTIQAHQSAKNPNRAKYLIGEVVSTPMGNMTVVGYDNDGEPLVEAKK